MRCWASRTSSQDPARLLFAERDQELRLRLSKELSCAGYYVDTVATREALREALEVPARYALIVAGPCPRTGDAMRALQELRLRGYATPFLVLVTYPDDVLRDAAFRLGARTFERPFRPVELCSYVRCLVPGGDPRRSWRGRTRIPRPPSVSAPLPRVKKEEGRYEPIEQ